MAHIKVFQKKSTSWQRDSLSCLEVAVNALEPGKAEVLLHYLEGVANLATRSTPEKYVTVCVTVDTVYL